MIKETHVYFYFYISLFFGAAENEADLKNKNIFMMLEDLI